LQAYQLILWKQCHWLVHTKGFPAELESLVHDLWAVRMQLLKARVEELSDPETPSQVFSTQSEKEPSTEAEEAKQSRRRSKGKDTPTLRDTLALCYLATLLLRLPVSIGDIHRSVMAVRSSKHVSGRHQVEISAGGPSKRRSRLLGLYAWSL